MSELSRILALPVDDRDGEDLVGPWTKRLRRLGGSWSLHPHQALGLEYAATGTPGLFLRITVGGGKTLLGALLPKALGIPGQETVVLCPPALVQEAELEMEEYQQHFDIDPPIYLPYTQLSATDSGDLLSELRPRLIIADEAHSLKNPKAARSGRFVRYMRANPETRFVAMSATFTNSSVKEYAHLAQLSLGAEGSPVPTKWIVLEAWSRVLDVQTQVPPSTQDYYTMAPLADAWAPGEGNLQSRIRQAFGRRMGATPGVVTTDSDSSPAEIEVSTWMPKLPVEVQDTIDEVRRTGTLPNDDGVEDLAGKVTQLAHGFYYYLDWAAIGRTEPDLDWVYARREYEAALREVQGRGRKGMDSRALLERALRSGDKKVPLQLRHAWEQWQLQADKPVPPRKAAWISTAVLEQAIEFAMERPNCLVWAGHEAVQATLEEMGFPVAWPGQRPKSPHVCVSIASHSVGFNLQSWHHNLVLAPPASGGRWQQLLGRTDRFGQTEPVVYVAVAQQVTEMKKAFAGAKKRAQYIQETQELEQKLLHARYV